MATASFRLNLRRVAFRALTVAALGALAGSMPARAQSPFLTLGIYGGVPQKSGVSVKYTAARLTRASATPNHIPSLYSITLPLNGQQNYSFYYQPYLPTPAWAGAADSPNNAPPPEPPYGPSGFLSAGTYTVTYLNAAGQGRVAGTVTYKPNKTFTNGVPVPNNPPNLSPTAIVPTPLGIQGKVTFSLGPLGPDTILHPAQNVTVQLLSAATGTLLATVPTNGDGFYSFYYTYGSKPGFIPPGKYVVRAHLFGGTLTDEVTYTPDTDPTSLGYYVTGARAIADFDFAQP